MTGLELFQKTKYDDAFSTAAPPNTASTAVAAAGRKNSNSVTSYHVLALTHKSSVLHVTFGEPVESVLMSPAEGSSSQLSFIDVPVQWVHWVYSFLDGLLYKFLSAAFNIQHHYFIWLLLSSFRSFVEALMYLIYAYQYNKELLMKGLYRGHDEELLGYYRRECLLVRKSSPGRGNLFQTSCQFSIEISSYVCSYLSYCSNWN